MGSADGITRHSRRLLYINMIYENNKYLVTVFVRPVVSHGAVHGPKSGCGSVGVPRGSAGSIGVPGSGRGGPPRALIKIGFVNI